MKKKLLVVVALLMLAATSAFAQTDKASKKAMQTGTDADKMMIDNSRATWEAYKSRNVAAIKALTAEEYVAYTLGGPSNLQNDIATIDKLTIESYTIDDPKVTWVTKDVAILRYKSDLKGSFDGNAFKPVYASEVWVNRGGKWRIISYTETPVM